MKNIITKKKTLKQKTNQRDIHNSVHYPMILFFRENEKLNCITFFEYKIARVFLSLPLHYFFRNLFIKIVPVTGSILIK